MRERMLWFRRCVPIIVLSVWSRTRFGVDAERDKNGKARGRRKVAKEEACAARETAGGSLSERAHQCAEKRAVTERDGVTKGGTRMRWNGTYTPRLLSLLLSRVTRKRGRIDTVPMETRRRLSPKTFGPSTSSRLSCSLCCPSLAPPCTLIFLRSTSLPPARSLYLSVRVYLSSFSSRFPNLVPPPWPPSLRNTH